ncbi:hypothetical protein ABT390_36525 [Streptomyces aurantiacus]|uniref:Putative Mucin-19 n=1 Tax=Streptomyces aurantiacus JA 4570 TaxID=1286094 RepID=S4AH67_9ACTN|nr:hypothetical protein [Streptomyces aurantiacus]EPH40842.1 putative Mucin-19 [Streptomyces aurantiacus JA 4570]
MARYQFGASVADFVVQPQDGIWGVAPGVAVTFWDSPTGGTWYTDLLAETGAATSQVVTDASGAIPEFQGPEGVTGMWADAGGTTRVWITARGTGGAGTSKGLVFAAPTGPAAYVVWRAPRACVVSAVHGYRQGGTGATVNAQKNGADLLATDLSLSTADTWLTGPAVQGEAMAAGDSLAVAVRAVSGEVTAVTVQIDVQGV